MDQVGYVAGQLIAQLPALLVLVVGLALVAARRRMLTGRSGALAVAGLIVLLVGVIATVGWTASFPWLIGDDVVDLSDFGLLAFAVGMMLTLLHAVGLALMIAALLASGRRAAPVSQWEPPEPPTAPPLR
ncbi:hypothetical protein WEI85_35320 [Actinomycetes bacterium KLBMP 9797]